MKKYLVLTLSLMMSGSMASAFAASEKTTVTVHKSPTCGCCGKWEEHLKKEGFEVKSVVSQETEKVKDEHKIPRDKRSCHTGIVNGYYVEGHVPAETLKRFLKEKPKGAVGLTVPGMPIGSPGMELGDRIDPYSVYKIDQTGKAVVYESFPKKK